MEIYSPQITHSDCGFACLKTLIGHFYQDENVIYISQDENRGAYSFALLKEIALDYGISLEGIEIDDLESIKDMPLPFIGLIRKESENLHYVYVNKIKHGDVHYYDPDEGEIVVYKKEFNKIFSKKALIVKEFNKKDIVFNNKLPKEKKFDIFYILFQLFSFSSLAAAIYFLDDKTNIYIPIILLIVALISEISFRQYLLKKMKKMDKEFLYRIDIDKKKYYDFFSRYEDYKNKTINSKNGLVFAFIAIMFLTIIVLLNNIYNAFIILIPLLIAIIDIKIVNVKTKRKEKEISLLEKNIAYLKTIDTFKNQLQTIHTSGYKLASNILIKRYIYFGILLITSLLTTVFNETFYLPYVVFYFAISYTLLEQFINFFKYPLLARETLISKIRLSNYINEKII